MEIWCADTVSKYQEAAKTQNEQTTSLGHIHTRQNRKGNGAAFLTTFLQTHTIPMTTWIRPQLTKHEKQQLKHYNNPTQAIREIQKEKLITWKIPETKTDRQIDHILINHRYRN